MKYALLNTLLPHLEAFERAYPGEQDPQRFAAWLIAKTAPDTTIEQADHSNAQNAATTHSDIVRLIDFLHRYARSYARKALEGSPLGSIDEFAYLATLQQAGQLNKTELIYKNRHEKPTGMEIIRRLLDLGLIEQTDDTDDRRTKKLTVSAAGAAVILRLYDPMQTVFRLIAGSLTQVEGIQLLHILEKLERFHRVVQAKVRESEKNGGYLKRKRVEE